MSWDGLLLINKPAGVTSHTVVQEIKNRLKAEKAGHLGTLDPIATGVFPVCLGKATRLTPFYMGADKTYLARIRFGFFTTTDDREGKRDSPYSKPKFSREQLERVVSSFQGEFQQRPPIFSAKKIQGKKAYDLARKGIRPELPLQTVKIYQIKVVHFEKDLAVIHIHCGSGTYVRSIARELGVRLRCGAHVDELSRTAFNSFTLEQCAAVDAPEAILKKAFLPISRMLAGYPELTVDSLQGKKILNGSAISVEQKYERDWVKVFDENKTLLAIAQTLQGERTELQPRIVFHA